MSVASERGGARILTALLACIVSVATLEGPSGCASEAPERVVEVDAGRTLPTPVDGGFLAAEGCVACLEASCGHELLACDLDPPCHAVHACRAACTDAECDARCLEVADGGATLFTPVAECAEFNCLGECRAAPARADDVATCRAGVSTAFSAPVYPSCQGALECACDQCGPDALACLADPKCAAVVDCVLRTGCVGRVCSGNKSDPVCDREMTALSPFRTDSQPAFRVVDCVRSRCGGCTWRADAGADSG